MRTAHEDTRRVASPEAPVPQSSSSITLSTKNMRLPFQDSEKISHQSYRNYLAPNSRASIQVEIAAPPAWVTGTHPMMKRLPATAKRT